MASKDGQSYTLWDTSTTDTLPLNHDFFRPLGMEHFYDSFALVSEISVRREALHLFGLRADELLPDLHITRDCENIQVPLRSYIGISHTKPRTTKHNRHSQNKSTSNSLITNPLSFGSSFYHTPNREMLMSLMVISSLHMSDPSVP